MIPIRNAFAAALAALLAMAGGSVQAGTASSSISVSATVVSSCIVSGATLNFGAAIDPTAATVIDSSTSITVVCTATTPYAVALNAGVNAGGASNFGTRAIKNGLKTLGYQLYADALHTTVWGDGTSASATVPGLGTGSNQSLTVYGRLPSVAGAVPGTYSDTVTVTVTY